MKNFKAGVINTPPLIQLKADTLFTYSIDGATGALKPIGKYPTGKGSNWVEIVSFD